MNRSIKSTLDTLARHSKALETMSVVATQSSVINAAQALQEKNAEVQRMSALLRSAAGPIEELRRAGVFAQELLSPALDLVPRMPADFGARFCLPKIAETAGLLAKLQPTVPGEVEILKRYHVEQSSLQHAAETMLTPWLDMKEPLHSMGGFAALQGIGHALKNMPAFGHILGAALRVDLGDWRDTITWPTEIFTNLGVREDFYVSRGFNSALTDFPVPAFEESLHIAGLRREPPSLVDLYGPPIPGATNDEEKEDLARTNKAHKWLIYLEMQMRNFINERMTKAFGSDWPKHRLPNGVYDEWQEKKRKAQQQGTGSETDLIAYADFTDYEKVICKRDNWKAFEPFFQRKEDMRESFQRLYPIRVDTMHARPITPEDELLLYVEARRLGEAMIGKKVK